METPGYRLINGQPDGVIDPSDRSFQYGDGVFSTLRVSQGRPLFLAEHLARLVHDSAVLRLPVPDQTAILGDVDTLCGGCPEGVLKIQLSRGPGERGYRPPAAPIPTRVTTIRPIPALSPAPPRPWRVRLLNQRLAHAPGLAGVKHCNRLEQILARMEWDEAETDEGLMLDAEGCLTEGTMTNVFLFRRRQLKTPLLDRCGVKGIFRAQLMAWARARGIPVVEDRLWPDELWEADDVLLTNSVIGVVAIESLEGRPLKQSGLGKDAHAWYLEAIERNSSR